MQRELQRQGQAIYPQFALSFLAAKEKKAAPN